MASGAVKSAGEPERILDFLARFDHPTLGT